MEDPRDQQYNQGHREGKEPHWTKDDLAAYASANANYYYQMSLWWWNTYMHNLHARTQPWESQFENHSCECAERSMMEEDDYECCQNDHDFESQGSQMNLCKNCPGSQLCAVPPWQRLHGEYYSSENHHDLNVAGNQGLDDDNDNNHLAGDGDHDDHSDSDNGDDDESDDEENSDIDMEVDDNFRKFLEQSEKHRQEREQSKLSVIKFLLLLNNYQYAVR